MPSNEREELTARLKMCQDKLDAFKGPVSVLTKQTTYDKDGTVKSEKTEPVRNPELEVLIEERDKALTALENYDRLKLDEKKQTTEDLKVENDIATSKKLITSSTIDSIIRFIGVLAQVGGTLTAVWMAIYGKERLVQNDMLDEGNTLSHIQNESFKNLTRY